MSTTQEIALPANFNTSVKGDLIVSYGGQTLTPADANWKGDWDVTGTAPNENLKLSIRFALTAKHFLTVHDVKRGLRWILDADGSTWREFP